MMTNSENFATELSFITNDNIRDFVSFVLNLFTVYIKVKYND